MPNRFDQPAQHRFINSFTPIPFSELAAAGAARQGRFDENAARLDAAQVAVDQMQAIPNSADQAKVEQWRTQMGEFADEFIDKDISDPEVYRKIKTGIRSIVNPNELSAIGQSHQGYQAYKKVAAQMQARGEQVYNPQDFTGYSSLETGIFTGQPMMDLGADAEQAIKSFMSKPELDWREIQLGSGRIGIEHYRDINKINQLIDSGEFGQLLNSPAIQQLMEREGLDEQGFKEQLRELAPSYEQAKLTSAAYPPGYSKDKDPEYTTPSSAAGPAVTKAGISGRPGFRGRQDIKKTVPSIEDIVPGLGFEKKSFDERLEGFFQEGDEKKSKKLEFKTEQDKTIFNQYADATKNYYGIKDFGSLSDKDKIEKIDEYLNFKWTQQRNPEVYEYTVDELPEEAKIFETQMKLNPMFANRAVYDPTESMGQELGTARELLDEYPLEAGYSWTPVGRTSDLPRQELALAKQIEIRDEKGESMGTYWIAGSDQERQGAAFDNQLTTELMYSDLPEGTFDINLGTDESSQLEWKVDEKQGQLPTYRVRITHPDGSGINWISSTSVADLKNQLFQQLSFFSQ